jgi:hypothetical protein
LTANALDVVVNSKLEHVKLLLRERRVDFPFTASGSSSSGGEISAAFEG